MAASTASDLVAYANKLLGLSLDFAAELKKGDLAPVVAAVSPKTADLLAVDAETDVEGALSMLADVILAALPADKATAEAKKLIATATANADDDKALLRLRVATNVFNKAAALPALRFDALIAIIGFAGASGHVALVSGYFDSAEQLVGAPLSLAQRRTLFLTIANVIEKEDAASLKVLIFLEKYLTTFAGVTDAKELDTGKDVAARAAKLVLKQPVSSFLARVDLLANPVVEATLKPCKTNGKLFALLEIVSTKTLAEFAAFQKADAAVFKAHGLDEAELAATMRLFTLASLPTGFEEVSYAAVAKTLDVPEDEVEPWVVRAITANVVTAKIDQLRRTVVVSRALQRGFGAAQWAEVDAKLQQYKSNVGALLQIIRNARQAQAAQ